MHIITFLLIVLMGFSGFSQSSITPEQVKSLVIDYYSFADSAQFNRHLAVTHPKLQTDSLRSQFIREVNTYRYMSRFSEIGISEVKLVSEEIYYDNFLISKWKVSGYEELELTNSQLVHRQASIDSINFRNGSRYSQSNKYYVLKEGTENVIQSFTNWHVLLYRYSSDTKYYVIPYETRPTPPYTSVFPYEGNKLRLALQVVPLAALMQLEHVDGLRCQADSLPLDQIDKAIVASLHVNTIEVLACRIGINYRTVQGIKEYDKKTAMSKFEAIVTMYNRHLSSMQLLKSRYEKHEKRGVVYVNTYEGATYTKRQNSDGEFCAITMRFKIMDRMRSVEVICYHASVGWIIVDINESL